MPNTTNISHTEWDGRRGSVHLNLTSDGTALSTFSLLDISALSPPARNVTIRTIQCTLYGNFILIGLVDADTDEEFMRVEGQTADVSFEFVRDFTDLPQSNWSPNRKAAGFTGDLLLTTSGLSNEDGFDLLITFNGKTLKAQ